MHISFDPSTLRQSRLGSITGVVYFEFDQGRKFPSLGWNDFVVVVASWWIVALKEIIEGATEVKLRFMDGPYWIAVASQESKLLLRCIDDHQGGRILYDLPVELDDLVAEIFGFARKVSEACMKAGISSADLDRMRTALPN